MKKQEKEYLLTLFLEQNESNDIVNLANEGFGINVYYIESKTSSFKSIFEVGPKKILINSSTINNEEARFLVAYHISEYVLDKVKSVSMVRLDNMDVEVYSLAQRIYQKSEDIKNKELKKGK